MNGLKRYLGIDLVDLVIQAGITGMMMAVVEISNGPDEALPAIVAASLVVLALRRRRAFQREGVGLTTGQMAAARIEELEERVAQLEAGDARVAELEERVDFAERLLAQGSGERATTQQEKVR